MNVNIKQLRYVMAEKYQFESKNENEKNKVITGFFLTFVSDFNEKIVISSSQDFEKLTNKWVDLEVELAYREFQGKKGFKLKIKAMTPTDTPVTVSKP